MKRPALIGALVLLLTGSPAFSQNGACPGTSAIAGSLAGTERQEVCDAAFRAEQRLARCGIKPRRPYFVELVPDVRNAVGNCIFGQFRAGEKDVAKVASPSATAALVAAIADDDPQSVLKRIPAAEFHNSLLVHEITHAIVHQNLSVPPCHAGHEYIAAVIQLDTMSDRSRRIYLDVFAGNSDYTTEMFNDIVLAMDPSRYAAAAYRHFQKPENGCPFLRRLLTTVDALPRLPE
jgi:hypothetical protein